MARPMSESPGKSKSTPSPKDEPMPDEASESIWADDIPSNTQIPFSSDSDNDSGLDDSESIASSSATLAESIFDYRTLHGRTFQNSKTTEYWGPNDDKQNAGLDIAHHFVTMLMGDRLFEAPLDRPPTKILDVGTGTGVWVIDMADAYPAADVIGTDISPIQPSWVPPNCSFFIEDAQDAWTFGIDSFDFVHIRALYGGISDWQHLYKESYAALRPGGWIEDMEFTIRLHSDLPSIRDDPNHIFKRWADVFHEAGDRMGRSLRIGVNGTMQRYMTEAGFTHITQKSYQVPIGPWSSDPTYRKIGIYNLAFMEESLEGFALFLLREIMGWEYAHVQVFLAEMRAALRNTKSRPYYLMTNVYGQK